MVAGKSIRLSDIKAPCEHGDGGRVYRRLEIFNSHRSCLRCVSPSYFRKLDIVGMSSAPAAFAQRPGISLAAFVEDRHARTAHGMASLVCLVSRKRYSNEN